MPDERSDPIEFLLNVLVNKDRVSVRVNGNKAGGSRSILISLGHKLDTLLFQLALKIPYVGEVVECVRAAVPARLIENAPSSISCSFQIATNGSYFLTTASAPPDCSASYCSYCK